jgi:Flp pilus assembly pilin Flp
MHILQFVQAWLASMLGVRERGQTAIEYVLMIMVVVLFLVAAALLLQGVLSGAVSSISSWIATQTPP